MNVNQNKVKISKNENESFLLKSGNCDPISKISGTGNLSSIPFSKPEILIKP
jgi:hypothetical protein